MIKHFQFYQQKKIAFFNTKLLKAFEKFIKIKKSINNVLSYCLKSNNIKKLHKCLNNLEISNNL